MKWLAVHRVAGIGVAKFDKLQHITEQRLKLSMATLFSLSHGPSRARFLDDRADHDRSDSRDNVIIKTEP